MERTAARGTGAGETAARGTRAVAAFGAQLVTAAALAASCSLGSGLSLSLPAADAATAPSVAFVVPVESPTGSAEQLDGASPDQAEAVPSPSAPTADRSEAPSEAGEPEAGDTAEGSESAGFAQPAVERRPRNRRMPPASPEEADDPMVAAAMRAAPPLPALPPQYRGRDEAMQAAREIRRRVPRLVNYRAAIPFGRWDVEDGHAWRVDETEECLARLDELGVRARPYEPDPDEEQPLDVSSVPTPVVVTAPIGGVRFISGRGPLLVSCALAARLATFAEVAAEHGIERVIISSSFRERPLSSFHTMGMGLDITRLQATEPLVGADGEASRWLVVRTDFVETLDRETCDPSLLDPEGPLAGNERAQRLLAVACALHETGTMASVLTPNYNDGHRDHFHVDIRPDDPRTFVR